MKKYKRLKFSRKLGPLIIIIPILARQNLSVIILVAVAWVLIDLKFIEPKLPRNNKRAVGELFVVEPMKNTFLIGKVIKKQIPSDDPIMNGGHLIYLFQQTSNPLDIPEYLNPKNLIIPPQIIDSKGWEKGYFQTIGIQEVTHEELHLNYGFWDIETNKFVNDEGKELSHKPDIYSDYGLFSYGSIIDELKIALNAPY